MAKVLLIEDDVALSDSIVDLLRFERHEVESVTDGLEAAERLKFYAYDFVILDLSLPSKSGIEVLREFRHRGGATPVLILTGKNAIQDKEIGLDSGADDYLTKPFDVRELMARMRALLRRPHQVTDTVLTAGDVVLDTRTFMVTRAGEEIKLLPKEFALLEFLVRHRYQVFNVDELLDRVWSSETESTTDAVRQCITRIRKKLDRDGEPSVIVTVTGLGYKVDLAG